MKALKYLLGTVLIIALLVSPLALAADKGVIAVSFWTMDIPVIVAQYKAIEREAAKHGYKVVLFDPAKDIQKQGDQFQIMIQQKVKGVICMPADGKGILPATRELKRAGIPVVFEDANLDTSPAAKGLCSAFVSSDNFRAGEMAAEYIVWRLKGKGKIGVMGWRAATSCRDREDGLMNVLKGYPEIQVAAYGEAVSIDAGVKNMEDFMQRVPDLDAVYCVNDPAGIGAYNAIKAKKKEGRIFIVANDGEPQALKLIKETKGKTYAMTIGQWPQIMGKVAVRNLIAVIENRPKDILSNVKVLSQELMWPYFFPPPFPITYETVDKYPSWDKDVELNDIAPVIPWWKPYNGM